MVGHVAPLACVIGDRADPTLARRAIEALGGARLESWGDPQGELLDAILSHHGKPWPREDDRHTDRRYWHATRDGYDPFVALESLRRDADALLPETSALGASPLPTAPGFTHAVAGLAQLADWVASSEWERAPDAASRGSWATTLVRRIGLDPEPWRAPLRQTGVPSFEVLFDNLPYPHQSFAGSTEGRLLVLEAETGSGKTEAALWRFANLFAAGAVDGLFFALPTRSAAVQLHGRVERFAAKLWQDGAPPVVLAVPGYLDDRSNEQGLPAASDPLDLAEGDERAPTVWAAEHPKRYFTGVLSVGTVDQALFAALRVKHAHMRGALLMRHLLVVDEVHASDAYMRRLLSRLLRDHLAAGGHAVLLSATLGAEARHQFVVESAGGRAADHAPPAWAAAADVPYPLLSFAAPAGAAIRTRSVGREKVVHMEERAWLDDAVTIAANARVAAERGARVLIVRNTVDGAVAVQRALESQGAGSSAVGLKVAGVPTLHHGRFAREDRRLLDAAVEQAIGRERAGGGCVVVGTQTLEQSLDLDADLLITDLCPADVLLQRVGRLHRHRTERDGRPRTRPPQCEVPRVIVLVPAEGLSPFLAPSRPGSQRRHGLGHRLINGLPEGVYPDLLVLEATRRLLAKHRTWSIPDQNRQLVEGALHSEALELLLDSLPEEERERWRLHRNAVLGSAIASAQLATDGALFRDRGFREAPNANFDERLVTRLGADDRLLELPAGSVGPFGEPVRRLTLPGWMARGVPDDATPEVTGVRDELGTPALFVRIAKQAFTYDRHGLRREKEER
jgi:CRISPR-associated endonuclease/helicase Cas3